MTVIIQASTTPLAAETAVKIAEECDAEFGLVYAAGFYAIIKRDNAGWCAFHTDAEAPTQFYNWDQVYEMRLFGNSAEVRWVRDGLTGLTWRVGEDHHSAFAFSEPYDAALKTDETALVWGEVDGAQVGGWSPLRTARFGRHWVPISLASTQRARIILKTYWAPEPGEHGNLTQCGERLVGFEAIDMPKAGEKS